MTLDKAKERAYNRWPITEEEIPYLDNLGAVIKETRLRAGLYVKQAASVAELHHLSWRRIEAGTRRTRRSTLLRIATALAPDINEDIQVLYAHLIEQAGPALAPEPGMQRRPGTASGVTNG